MNTDVIRTAALEKLNKVFGYAEFRFNQSEIVESVIAGGDALVLMPTGGGKSLCYQIPALLRNGTAIVISPLIALMQDQVIALQQTGVRAEFINSTLSYEESERIQDELLSGELNLLYMSPERLLQQQTFKLLHKSKISLFAIDEAHCVSRWGHDFRPEYMQLSKLHEEFPDVPRIALTATADQRTRDEIIHQLGLQDAKLFINSFDRPNINFSISDKKNGKKRLIDLIKRKHARDSGIVYCLSRKRTDSFAEDLKQAGFTALPYHAGMSAEQREFNQNRFLREEGIIMVATIAFGMGIDKPNVRFVAHVDLPKSVEAYYQQVGRAGRDGLPSTAWMIYGYQDVISMRGWINDSDAPDQVKRIEHEKLNSLLGLCETIECRRTKLLEYFDEIPKSEQCGNCDNCELPPTTWDATEHARKALSCIHKTGQRFGISYIVDVLTGVDSDKIKERAHNSLSVYGIGKDLSKTAWNSVIRQLILSQYIHVDVERYSVLSLREECRPLLKGEEEFRLRELPKGTKAKKQYASSTVVKPEHEVLFELLREERLSLASEFGIPPYAVFHDKTLLAMAEHQPQSEEEMLAISGIAEFKFNKYGENFLEVIEEYVSSHAE